MRIKGLSIEQIKTCADKAGWFRLDNVRRKGNFIAFVLRMAGPIANIGRLYDKGEVTAHHHMIRYRKRGMNMERWTGAVCFHGHKAFMDEVFKLNPEALIVTTMARYEGKEDFDRKWVGTGMRPHGMGYMGLQYREFCDCYGG